MARPKKVGLDYFPLDADFFEDNKIKILKARYKADGVTIYLYLLCEIYKQGYYIKVDDDFEYIISDDLGIDRNKVKQVLNFLLKRSLFNDKLFGSDKVLTSTGIQKRFQLAIKERARKNPIEVGRYWLLNERETEPFIKCTLFEINTGNTPSFSGKNLHNSTEESLKKSKVNNIYINTFQTDEIRESFQTYLRVREQNYGPISEEQKNALAEELAKLSSDPSEQLAIVKKATAGGWKSFYKLKRNESKVRNSAIKKKSFDNFERRNYDMESLEQKLLRN